MKRRRFYNIYQIINKYNIFLIFGVITIFLMGIYKKDSVEILQKRNNIKYSVVKDYSYRELKDENAPAGIKKEYQINLENYVNLDEYLVFFTNHHYVEGYLDNELVYSLNKKETQISRAVGRSCVMIPINREDQDKTIKLVLTPVYKNTGNEKVEILIGSLFAICKKEFLKEAPQLLLGFFSVFLGMFFIIVSLINIMRKNQGRVQKLSYLGLFSMVIGFWGVTDTRFMLFMMPKSSVFLHYFSILMTMVIAIPLLKWTEAFFNRQVNKIFNICCFTNILFCLLQLAIQISGIMDLREMMFVTYTMLLCDIMVMFAMVVKECKENVSHTSNTYKKDLLYMSGFSVITIIISYYIRKTSAGLLFILVVFNIYILYMGVITIIQYGEQELQLAKMEKELAEKQVATLMSQIRPHFIYNTLGTISYFCKTESEKAAKLTNEFAMYLRGNFINLDNLSIISFGEELEHVKHYLNIEQARFPDISVEYKLEAKQFQIPPLTIQPLVENAIKHGLMGREEGGKVEIITKETASAYCIYVMDDGIGFDVDGLPEDKKHVGIKNIQTRLKMLCNGNLIIRSELGKGTTACVTIPKEEIDYESTNSR